MNGLPPGPRLPALQLLHYLRAPLAFSRRVQRDYGDVATWRLLGRPPIVMVHRPEHIKAMFMASSSTLKAGSANEILRPFLGEHSVLLLDGPRHRNQRRLLLPPFRREQMLAHGQKIYDITHRAIDRWPRGTTFTAMAETRAVTLDVILQAVFGATGPLEAEIRALVVETTRLFENPLLIASVAQVDVGRYSPWGRYRRVAARMDDALFRLIDVRRTVGGDDILSTLLRARHQSGEPMSNTEIRDELLTLLFAGHETTASALGWALHRLSQHPEVLLRARDEVDSVFGGSFEPSRVSELRYLTAFCRETLRTHPVILGVVREVQSPFALGGYDLPSGILLGANAYLAHHNPSTWENPQRFWPDRFLSTRHSPHHLIPFGGGIRRCVGEAFALFEMQVVLAAVLARVRPVSAPGYTARTARRGITLCPNKGLPLRVMDRRYGK